MCALRDVADAGPRPRRVHLRPRRGVRGRRDATRSTGSCASAGSKADFAITGEPTDLHIGVQAKGVLAVRVAGRRHGRARLDAVARRQRDPEGPRRLPANRDLAVQPRVVRPLRPSQHQPRADQRRRRVQQGARSLRDGRRHPLPPRPGPGRDPRADPRAARHSRSSAASTWPPAVVERTNPYVVALRDGDRRPDRGRGDERRARRRVGRDHVPRRGHPGGRVRPDRRRPPRPRRVGLDRLAGALPPGARRLHRRPARAARAPTASPGCGRSRAAWRESGAAARARAQALLLRSFGGRAAHRPAHRGRERDRGAAEDRRRPARRRRRRGDDHPRAPSIDAAKPGKPQTVLLHRLGQPLGRQAGRPGALGHDDARPRRPEAGARRRSCRSRATCASPIPGHGLAKINDAYALGGPKLAVETVKALTGLKIHHVVNVNFKGFREVVNLFDCFYVDVDRRYFHSNKGVPFGQRYDAIDIQPGLPAAVRHRRARLRALPPRRLRPRRAPRASRTSCAPPRTRSARAALIDDLEQARARRSATPTQTDENLRVEVGLPALRQARARARPTSPSASVAVPRDVRQGPQGEQEVDYVEAAPARSPRPSTCSCTAARDEGRSRGRLVKRKADAQLRRRRAARRRARARRASATAAIRERRPGFTVRFPALPDAERALRRGRGRAAHVRAARPRRHPAPRLPDRRWRRTATTGSSMVFRARRGATRRCSRRPSEVRRVRGRRLELFRSGSRLRFVAWRTRPRRVLDQQHVEPEARQRRDARASRRR